MIIQKRHRNLFLAIGIAIIFIVLIEELYIEYLIQPILSKVRSHYTVDIVFLAFLYGPYSTLDENTLIKPTSDGNTG